MCYHYDNLSLSDLYWLLNQEWDISACNQVHCFQWESCLYLWLFLEFLLAGQLFCWFLRLRPYSVSLLWIRQVLKDLKIMIYFYFKLDKNLIFDETGAFSKFLFKWNYWSCLIYAKQAALKKDQVISETSWKVVKFFPLIDLKRSS